MTAPPVLSDLSTQNKFEIEHYIIETIGRVERAGNWINTQSAIVALLGHNSFSAGIIAGMAKNFWPHFDEEAKKAFAERALLIAAVEYAFEHPAEIFGKITKEQEEKYARFKAYKAKGSLAGEFQAGVLFGELLFDVFMIVEGVGALAKLAAKVPGLLRMLPRLQEIMPAVRAALKNSGGAGKAAKTPAKNVETAAPRHQPVEDGANSGGTAIGETAGSVRNVNPGYPTAGRTQNCVNCTVATDATLSGNPAVSLPSNGPVSNSVLENLYGSRFGTATTNDVIAQQMLNAGDGARGIVFGSRGPSQAGHVFNVVNQNGVVRFLDGQTGAPATFNGYINFHLLRAN